MKQTIVGKAVYQFAQKHCGRWNFGIDLTPPIFGPTERRYKKRLSNTASFIKGMFEVEEVKLAIRVLQFMNHEGLDNKILNENDEIKELCTKVSLEMYKWESTETYSSFKEEEEMELLKIMCENIVKHTEMFREMKSG